MQTHKRTPKMQTTAAEIPPLEKNTLRAHNPEEMTPFAPVSPPHIATAYNVTPIISLFSSMPDFAKMTTKPCTPTENNMQYWFKYRSNLEQTEIQSLLYDVRYIRNTNKKGNKIKFDKKSIIISLCGFSSYIDRDVFLRMIRHAFQPRLLYASEVANNQWEAIMVLNYTKYSPNLTFHGRDQFVDYVQKFCDLFKLSICVLEIPSWTDPATITAIQRIQKGFRSYGNWENIGNNELRLEFELAQEYKTQSLMNEEIRRATNMEFTTGNMQHLFHELRNSRIDYMHLTQTNNRLAAMISNTIRNIQDGTRILTQQSMHIQHLHVSTYTLIQAENQMQGNSQRSNSNQSMHDLQQFNNLVQGLQQQNELVTNALNSTTRYLRTSFLRSDLPRIFNTEHTPATPVYNNPGNPGNQGNQRNQSSHENQGHYVSPPQSPYPASPPPQAHPPPRPPPPPQDPQMQTAQIQTRQTNRLRNAEVIDLTNDDTLLHTIPPHTTIQILRRAPRQQNQPSQLSFSHRARTATLSVPLPAGLQGLTREEAITGARVRSTLLHYGTSLDDDGIDVD